MKILVSILLATGLILAIASEAISDDNGRHLQQPASPGRTDPGAIPVGVSAGVVPAGWTYPRRFESPSGTSLANGSADSYYRSRIRVDLTLQPTPWLKLFVQAQHARVGAHNTAPASTTCYNPIDWRHGYGAFVHQGKGECRCVPGVRSWPLAASA
jgi:hypothetical protein